jgi:hypothetical protein
LVESKNITKEKEIQSSKEKEVQISKNEEKQKTQQKTLFDF